MCQGVFSVFRSLKHEGLGVRGRRGRIARGQRCGYGAGKGVDEHYSGLPGGDLRYPGGSEGPLRAAERATLTPSGPVAVGRRRLTTVKGPNVPATAAYDGPVALAVDQHQVARSRHRAVAVDQVRRLRGRAAATQHQGPRSNQKPASVRVREVGAERLRERQRNGSRRSRTTATNIDSTVLLSDRPEMDSGSGQEDRT